MKIQVSNGKFYLTKVISVMNLWQSLLIGLFTKDSIFANASTHYYEKNRKAKTGGIPRLCNHVHEISSRRWYAFETSREWLRRNGKIDSFVTNGETALSICRK